jgi:hypothetical protein
MARGQQRCGAGRRSSQWRYLVAKKYMQVQRAVQQRVIEGAEGAAAEWLKEHPEDHTPPSSWEVEEAIVDEEEKEYSRLCDIYGEG